MSEENYQKQIESLSRDLADSPKIRLVEKLGEFLNDYQIVRVLQIMNELCHHCWDSPRGCQCWNDE